MRALTMPADAPDDCPVGSTTVSAAQAADTVDEHRTRRQLGAIA